MASCSRSSSTSRSASIRGSASRRLGCACATLGFTQRASSSRRPASRRPGSSSPAPADGFVAASDSFAIAVPRSSGALTVAARLGCHVLVQALGDLDEQACEQVAIGLDVAQLGKHPLDGGAGVVLASPHLVAQALDLLGQALGEVAPLDRELVGHLGQALLERLGVLAQAALQLLVGIGAQVLFLAELD